uniref:Uncharacterized protein n=1 Tax=Anguilla anguilla TaxID=7936 RepID=A0A0E9XQP3_ANGAN
MPSVTNSMVNSCILYTKLKCLFLLNVNMNVLLCFLLPFYLKL